MRHRHSPPVHSLAGEVLECDTNAGPLSHKSALVAMSGGVDSTVAAILTLQDGLECAGAVMDLFDGSGKTIEDARVAAAFLGIPFYEFDFKKQFADHVIDSFISDYREGRTPNPCIVCNKHLKFGELLNKAHELGKDYIVTGHYAQVEYVPGKPDTAGRYLLKKGVDLSKDQSYALYTLTQEQLAKVRFPLGGLLKKQVREIASEKGFLNTNKNESQDICFIPDGDYFDFINKYTGKSPKKGRFIDTDGNDLGESKGISSYTIGQRRGLGLAMPYPPYVIELRPESNTVVVGSEDMLYSKSLTVNNINLISVDRLEAPVKATVKIRYSDPGHPAVVHQPEEDILCIEFDQPQRAITSGQAAVLYDENTVIGGGTIK